MEAQQDPGDRFAALARSLRKQSGEADTTEQALRLVVETIEGCDEAAVSLIQRRGRITTLNSTGDRALQADQLQYELAEGPCLDTIRDHETTLVRDLSDESRWPSWSRQVQQDLRFRSVLCFQLFTDAESYGALNMYSDRPDAFDDHDQSVGLAMAAHIAVAMASSRQIENLNRSVHSRGVIGQAMGIVMERYDLDDRRAFQFLQRVSAATDTRLFVVAARVAETRRLPALPIGDVDPLPPLRPHDGQPSTGDQA